MSQNPPVPDTNFELKHRIVGALILISFGVVVFPMILSGSKPVADPMVSDADVETPDTKVFVSKITPISGTMPVLERGIERPPAVADTAPKPVSKQASASASSSTANASQGKSLAKATEQKPESAADKSGSQRTSPQAKPAAPAKTTKTRDKTIERGWIVRVGTYSKPENAARIVDSLKALGFQTSSERLNTDSGVLTRVWVGPYAQRVEAGRARSHIQQATGEKGLIAAFP